MSLNIREDDLRMAGEKIGFERGIRKGRSEGRSEGILLGRQDGFMQGARQKSLETAKLMSQHSYPLSEICLMTGLSEEEIKKLTP